MNVTGVKRTCYTVVDDLIDDMTHRPGGLRFWWSLPKKGRDNSMAIRHSWADVVYTKLFPQSFIDILLQAALDQHGCMVGHTAPLYRWLLQYWYHNNPQELYTAWLELKGEV